jgi:hypothetical protein
MLVFFLLFFLPCSPLFIRCDDDRAPQSAHILIAEGFLYLAMCDVQFDCTIAVAFLSEVTSALARNVAIFT